MLCAIIKYKYIFEDVFFCVFLELIPVMLLWDSESQIIPGMNFAPVEYGAILTEAHTDFSQRLKCIADDMDYILEKFEPDCLSIEKLFFTNNQKTAIDVAQARGVIVLSAVRHGISIYEYTPLQVKQAVVGYGKAEKKQVMDMTRRILKLEQIPKPDDAADALALAICHGHCCKGIR